jgi:phthiodiolone/phenolphthiodiolone dimycocerosates ketoreductase
MKMLPTRYSDSEVDDILSKVSREMTEKSYIFGTVEEVSAEMQRHIDAGLNWIAPCDLLPMIGTPEEAAEALPRTLESCAILKGKTVGAFA